MAIETVITCDECKAQYSFGGWSATNVYKETDYGARTIEVLAIKIERGARNESQCKHLCSPGCVVKHLSAHSLLVS